MHVSDVLKLRSSASKEFRWVSKVYWTLMEVMPEVGSRKYSGLYPLYSIKVAPLCIMREEQCQSAVLSDHQIFHKTNVSLWFSIWWNCQLEAAAHTPGDYFCVFWHWCRTRWLAELFCQTYYSWVIKNGFWADDRFGSCSCEMMTFKIGSEKKDNNGTNWTSEEQTSACSGNW